MATEQGRRDKRQQLREQRIELAMRDCVHFTGIQHEVCAAGVKYADVRDESRRPFAFPCRGSIGGDDLPCASRQWMTREQAEAEERAFEELYARVAKCRQAIRAKHGQERGVVSEMPCPVGCGGTLRYSIASYNGHIHGVCSTADCASWME